MSTLSNSNYRSNPTFYRSQVTQVLPEFYQTEYPRLVTFLKKYYEYTGEDGSVSFDEKIHNLFGIRNISTADIESLDLLLNEISEGLETSSFYQNPRLMTRLLSHFFRNKGTQLSAEQFFKAFFNEDVEISYPKKDIFFLNDGNSVFGPQGLKYITDDKKYQIFSVLLKTGISFSDYEDLYKKLVHPSGFHLAAEVETVGEVSIGIGGAGVDPLETPNYAVVVQGITPESNLTSEYSLLTMKETDVNDADVVISSLEILQTYANNTLQELQDQYDTLANLVSVKPTHLDSENISVSSGNETLDEDDHE